MNKEMIGFTKWMWSQGNKNWIHQNITDVVIDSTSYFYEVYNHSVPPEGFNSWRFRRFDDMASIGPEYHCNFPVETCAIFNEEISE